MKNYKLSITVLRANPQILREIWISSAYTMQELTTVVCILLGIRKTKGEYQKNSGVEDSTRLEDYFAQLDSLYLKIRDSLNEKNSLLIDIGLVEEKETAEPLLYPRICCYRGDQIAGGFFDIALNNEVYDTVSKGTVDPAVKKKLRPFVPERCDLALRRSFAPQTLPNELQERYTLPIHEIIYSLKLQELKNLIDLTGYSIYPNQRKADLQRRFLEILGNQSYIQAIFENTMSPDEFKNMKSFLITGDVLTEDVSIGEAMPVLATGGFLYKLRDEWKLARGIYDYYRPWFNTKKEELFLARKYYKILFSGGLKLYGMISRKIMKNLLTACYPEENLEVYFEMFWKEAGEGKLIEGGVGIGQEYIFYDEDLSESFALSMSKKKTFFEEKYYYPDKEELEKIAEFGLSFENDQELETFCRHRLYLDREMTEELIAEAARYCHLGLDKELIADKICEESYGYGRQYLKRDCVRILQRLSGEVRSFELHGFKETELKGGRMR